MPRAVVRATGLPGSDAFPDSTSAIAANVATMIFDHRTTIQRDSGASGTGDWGQPGEPNWRDQVRDQPCYAGTVARGKETPADPSLGTTIDDRRVLFPLGTDIESGDRLLDVRDLSGNVVFDGPMLIEGPVFRRIAYLEAMIQKVS